MNDYLKEFLNRTGYGLLQFIKAMVITSIINFVVVLIGLRFAEVPYFGLLAFAIAIVDLLPVIGSGIVLIPWAIISLISGRTQLAIILVVIYVITFIIKQVLEPIILGKSIGLKPLYTLGITIVSMIVLTPAVGAIVGAIISIMLSVYLSMKNNDFIKENLK